MAQATIGALRVLLSADTAAFSKGLKQADGGMQRFSANAKKAFAAVAVAVAGVTTALLVGFKRTVAEADNLAKTAQSIGVPVEELSRLRHAADLSGVSMGQLTTAVGRLSRNMSDVAQGAGAEARRAFELLGIEVTNTDGTLKSSSDALEEVADRFAAMEDGSQKTALAMQIFGRAGADMIPMLNQGAAGIQRMKDEADALGIVIDTKTAQAAERFNDNLTRLARVKDGIITRMTAGMLPAFERLSQRLIDGARDTDVFRQVGEALGRAMEGLARAIMFVIDNISILIRVVTVFIALKIVAFVTRAGLAFVAFARAVQAAGLVLAAFNVVKRASMLGLAAMAAILGSVTIGFDKLEEGVANLWERIQQLVPEGAVEGLQGALKDLGLDIRSLTEEFRGLDEASDESAKTLAQLDAALNKTAGGMDKVGSATKGAAESIKDAEINLGSLKTAGLGLSQTLSSAFSRMFDGLVDGTFKARDAIAGLLKDLSRLLVNQAFQSLFGGGFGGGLFGGLPGFAHGGSFKVGGSGGIDSQIVAFRATPGEHVDVRTPGQDGGGDHRLQIALGVDVDQSGSLRPFVASVSSETATVVVDQFSRRALPSRVAEINRRPRDRG